jgi:hypothetical protein
MVVRLQSGVVTVLLAMVASSSSIRVSGDQNHTFRALALRIPPSLSDGQHMKPGAGVGFMHCQPLCIIINIQVCTRHVLFTMQYPFV